MARSNDRDRGKRSPKDLRDRRGGGKKKICIFCKEKSAWVDYKDVNLLRRFMSDRGKIRARRVSGNCAQHQREVAVAIKTSRELALLPYTQRTVTERAGGRGGPRGGGRGAPLAPRDLASTVPSDGEEADEIDLETHSSVGGEDDELVPVGAGLADDDDGIDDDGDE
jgi:small subunit ribosomal protein S18